MYMYVHTKYISYKYEEHTYIHSGVIVNQIFKVTAKSADAVSYSLLPAVPYKPLIYIGALGNYIRI